MTSGRKRAGIFDSASLRGYAVHLYTAAGIVPALFAAIEITSSSPEPGIVFGWLAVAVVIDATDGPLARRWQVDRTAPRVRGRTLDDIVDYLTFTFLPLLLVWRMSWVASPQSLWVALAMMTSLFGFAHVGAKEDDGGFFRGFPSYWNVFAFYAGIGASRWGTEIVTGILAALSVLTVLPVRFVYPNRAPSPWKHALVLGGFLWLGVLLAMLPSYPAVPGPALWASLTYPAVYGLASWHLGRSSQPRRQSASGRRPEELQ